MGGGEGFVELVGERAVVTGCGEVVPRWWLRGEEGVAACLPQRGKEAEDAEVSVCFHLCGQNESEKCERGVTHARHGRDALRRGRDVVEVFIEHVGERAVVAGFGEVVLTWNIHEGKKRAEFGAH